jgi:Zn-dependent peptidase ImmA (M78 family)
MSAMTVEVGTRSAILLGKDSLYPAHVAFYLAHEVGHIALGHIQPGSMVIDLDRTDLADPAVDAEEAAADAFALELLTGLSRPTILPC